MTRRKHKSDNHIDASPAKSLVEDLRKLREILRKTARAYTRRLDQEIGSVIEWAHSNSIDGRMSQSRIRDIGDMLTLVRKVEAKPDKGRRKDLKKIDSVVSDLRFFVEHSRSR
jgi:hypothetical protein